jgi:hypothetical protein
VEPEALDLGVVAYPEVDVEPALDQIEVKESLKCYPCSYAESEATVVGRTWRQESSLHAQRYCR